MSWNSRSQTKATLLRRLASPTEDKDAWREFVERYGLRIFRWCGSRGLQEADAQDLTQDLLVKLAIHMKRFKYDPSKSFHAWLKTITNNALADAFRKNQRAEKLIDNLTDRQSLMQDLRPQFDSELLDEAMARVEERVEPETWEAFRLTGIEALSISDAANQLKVPESRIRVYKGRVAKLIREEVRMLEGTTEE